MEESQGLTVGIGYVPGGLGSGGGQGDGARVGAETCTLIKVPKKQNINLCRRRDDRPRVPSTPSTSSE